MNTTAPIPWRRYAVDGKPRTVLCGMVILILALWIDDSHTVYESPLLLTVLNLAFSTLVLLLIAGLVGRSFLTRGEPGLLLLGCGALTWGLASAAAAAASFRDVNVTPAISATTGFIAAACHLAGVRACAWPPAPAARRKAWLALGYALAASCVGAISLMALTGWMPPFFEQGKGGTALRYAVLTMTVLMFSVTALRLIEDYRARRLAFSYYYGLALSLIAVGFFGVMIQLAVFSALFWVSLAAQFAGGVCMLLAALALFKQTAGAELSLNPLAKTWAENRLRNGPAGQQLNRLLLRYGAAVAAVAGASGARWLVTQWLGPGVAPYVTFFPAMMAVALLAGFGPGLLATFLSVLSVGFWILAPTGEFSLAGASAVNRFGIVLFAGSGVFMSIVAELFRQNRDRLAAHERAAALRDAQARLATFAEATFEGIVQSDAGRIVDCNEQFAQLSGYSVEELQHRDLVELIAPADRERVTAEVLAGRESYVEHGAVRKDGSRILVETRARLVAGSNRRCIAVRDITERRRMEEALREADKRLEDHLDNSPLAIVEFTSTFRVLRWSGAAERMFGWKAGEILGKCISELRWVHEEDREMVARISQEMVSGRQPRNFNINRNYRKDGSIIHCEWYNSAIYNGEGQLASVFSQVLDVTERKHAQTERDRFFELSIDIIAIAAAGEGRWKRVSPAFTQILGWSCEELLALPHIDELVHPDDLERSRQAYAGLLAGTPLVQFENRLRARDGTYRWFAWNTTPSIGDGLLYCVGRDITHRKANEEALKRAEAALREHAGKLEVLVNERTASLQETVDELERYSYSISHDMRAPLRAMNQYSQFLLEECEPLLPEEGRLYLRRISAASVRLDRLIQDVLTYHRVAQADMPLESVDLEALAREIVEGYPMIQPCGAEIHLVTPLLPVRGNLGALTQCLSNLLANAVKFTTPGVTPKVRIWTESHGAMVRVLVEDNGIGMEAGTLDRVWGIFQEVHETRNNAGTGIGLSIVKKAVQRMGGRVGLDSQPGNGSRFWFELRAAGNSAAS